MREPEDKRQITADRGLEKEKKTLRKRRELRGGGDTRNGIDKNHNEENQQ